MRTYPSVVLVPISLIPAEEGNDVTVAAYRPDGWLEETSVSERPTGVAQSLLHQTPGLDEEISTRLEPVGFVEAGTATQLVYTASVPMAATLRRDVESQDHAWTSLLPEGNEPGQRQDPVGRLVLDYWRHALSETTAAFDLLPQYFTTSQVRSIYGSVWGEPRDWSNFRRWLHTSNRDACMEVSNLDVGHEVDAALTSRLAATSYAAVALADQAARAAAVRAASRHVGISPRALGPVAGTIAPVVLAAAVAGGLIAYQRQVSRGKTPTWFTRTTRERVVLAEPYTTHPAWRPAGQSALPDASAADA